MEKVVENGDVKYYEMVLEAKYVNSRWKEEGPVPLAGEEDHVGVWVIEGHEDARGDIE